MPMPTLRLTSLAAVVLPLLLAGCGADGLKLPGFGDRSPEASAPAPSGPPAVSPLEVPIETGAAARPLGTANRETVDVAAYAAQGADWSVVVDGKAAALTRQGARPVRIPVRRIDFGGGVEFVGALGGQAFALTVRAADCQGGVPLSATVRYSGKSSAGCAAPATAEQVTTIAAAAPAPAPKKPAAPKPAAPRSVAPAPVPAPAPAPAAVAASPEATTPEAAVTVTPATTPAATAPAATTPSATAPAATAPAAEAATGTTPVATTTPEPAAPATTPATAEPGTEAPPQPSTGTATPPILIPGGPTSLPGAPPLATTPPADGE